MRTAGCSLALSSIYQEGGQSENTVAGYSLALSSFSFLRLPLLFVSISFNTLKTTKIYFLLYVGVVRRVTIIPYIISNTIVLYNNII